MIAVGVASPSAHGHAITRTATACTSAVAASPAIHHVAKNVTTAMARTIGTKMPETRSAVRWMGAFDPCACATRRTMPARSVSLAAFVASHVRSPSWFTVPAYTGSPGCFATGRDSPVSMLSSTADEPSRTMPSTGTLSPARTATRSPTAMSSTAISTVVPPRMTCAARGASRRSPCIAADAPAFARASRSLPSSTSVMTAAAASKYTWRSCRPSTVTAALHAYAIDVPSTTSTSMLAPPPRSACHAPT